jgi:hypothetical protein
VKFRRIPPLDGIGWIRAVPSTVPAPNRAQLTPIMNALMADSSNGDGNSNSDSDADAGWNIVTFFRKTIPLNAPIYPTVRVIMEKYDATFEAWIKLYVLVMT